MLFPGACQASLHWARWHSTPHTTDAAVRPRPCASSWRLSSWTLCWYQRMHCMPASGRRGEAVTSPEAGGEGPRRSGCGGLAGHATIIAVRSHGIRDGRLTDETDHDISSLRTGSQALLRMGDNAGRLGTAGIGGAMCRCGKRPTAAGSPMASRSWPPSAAWRSMPCGSMGSGRSARASTPWLTTARHCSGLGCRGPTETRPSGDLRWAPGPRGSGR